MGSFRALYAKFCQLRDTLETEFRGPSRKITDEGERTTVSRRIAGLARMIATDSPASIRDCAVKLRVLLDPGLGMGGPRRSCLAAPGR